MNETEAITQLKAGNIEGLKALVALYQVEAVQAAYLITQDRAAAEDIVQTLFLRAFERIKQFDVSRPFKPWFLRMVINEAIKEVARQRRHLSLEDPQGEGYPQLIELLEESSEAPEDMLQQHEIRQEIRKALARLSPQQRASIVLRYYLGYEEREMAEQMNCAPGTVRWHLSVARQRLRAWLSPLFNPQEKQERREVK